MLIDLVPFNIENLNYVNNIGPFTVAYIQTGPPYSIKDNILRCPLCNSNTFSELTFHTIYVSFEYKLKCYHCLYRCLLGGLTLFKLDFNSVACIAI